MKAHPLLALLGIGLCAAALAALPAAAVRATIDSSAAPAESLTLTLAPVGSFFQAGKPLKVKLTIENHGKASLATVNGVLFGQGIKVRTSDGAERTVKDGVVPAGAKQPLLLPAGASVTAEIDLSALVPDALAKAGKVTILDEVAGVTCTPLELELARDWSGAHAVIETDFGEIELEFFQEAAPRTVDNFLSLVEKGFYDGLTFHRIVKGFMVQGGDPNGDGSGNSGKFIPLETGKVKHVRGTIAMARQADPNSASCQFFLCHQDAAFLDNNYAAFGRIVRGLETLDRLADVPCVMAPGGVDRGPSKPKERVVIKKIRLVAPAAAGGR